MTETNRQSWRRRGEPDPVDIHVGNRIRTRRILLGKSQEVVAAQLGVSFQQLQKYESGANRVSASRLFDLAHILMTPISYFFDEMAEDLVMGQVAPTDPATPSNSVMSDRMTLDLIRDFYRIGSTHEQRCVLELVRAMADANARTAGTDPIDASLGGERRKPGPKPRQITSAEE